MVSSDIMRGLNDILVLTVLSQEDSYGYRISQAISRMSDNRYGMKETTLYSVLGRLERNGNIVSYSGGSSQGKERTYYSLTGVGRRYLEKKKDEWGAVQNIMESFIGKKS